jgi:hypothetical protein
MSSITPEHLHQYHQEGYCLVRGLIPHQQIQVAGRRSLEIAAALPNWPARHFQVLDPTRQVSATGQPLAGGIQQPASQDEVFAAVADQPHLAAAMGRLLDGPVERFTDQIGLKHAAVDTQQGGRSYFHQDSWYWKIAPQLGCNCWIPLTEVGAEASALAVMPGSHTGWKLTEHESYFDDPPMGHMAEDGFTAFKRHRIPAAGVDFSQERLIEMQPGDGLFFTNYTWHRSEPNRSSMTQAFYAIAYQRCDPA